MYIFLAGKLVEQKFSLIKESLDIVGWEKYVLEVCIRMNQISERTSIYFMYLASCDLLIPVIIFIMWELITRHRWFVFNFQIRYILSLLELQVHAAYVKGHIRQPVWECNNWYSFCFDE